jgi:DNA mismatch repair protein MutS
MRFSTAELGDLESRIASAADRALALELAHFDRLRAFAVAGAAGLKAVAAALARIDVAAALAELADAGAWVRPVVDESLAFEIRRGRHPVVEAALKRDGQAFVANDADLSAPASARGGRIALITGPNMAGKSTYLRQNALIAVLAQMGSFVPARSAHIGVIDRLFSRVGAADDLARGRSTFMVEMVETAGILNQATERSLVILDEIGRGTATFDGLSIAWAVVEYLHEVNRCRALFATHYHELTVLAGRLADVANVTMDVREWKDEIVFLHKVKPGAADRSYGIQVAKLAGLPKVVTKRAAAVLQLLEKADRKAPDGDALLADLPLFASRPAAAASTPEISALEQALAEISPDEMSPKAALEALYRLKGLLPKDRT